MNLFALRQIFEKQRLKCEEPGGTQFQIAKERSLLEQNLFAMNPV